MENETMVLWEGEKVQARVEIKDKKI